MVIGKRTYASREVHLHCEDANILRTLVDDGNVCDVDGRGGCHWFGGGHGNHGVCDI